MVTARGIYRDADSVALAVFVRQCGAPSRMADALIAKACREAHRLAVAKLFKKSPVFGGYLSSLNSGDEANETALAILSRLGKFDTGRGGRAVVNLMVTVAANGIRNRIRYRKAGKRAAETLSLEDFNDNNIGDAHGGEPERTGGGNETGGGIASIARAAADAAARARADAARGTLPGPWDAPGGPGDGFWDGSKDWVQTELEFSF